MKMIFSAIVVISLVVPRLVPAAEEQGSNQPRLATPTPAQKHADEQPPAEAAAKKGHYGPHTCTVFPITFYGSATLYQADHYENDNCNPPYLAYLYGTFPYPQTCGVDCEPYVCNSCGGYGTQPFQGLAFPIPADHEHELPLDEPRKYSRSTNTPDRVRFLKLMDVSGRDVYVRLFSFKINKADLIAEVDPKPENFRETIHVAFECQDPAAIGVDTSTIPKITDRQRRDVMNPGDAADVAFDVTFSFANGTAEAHVLTFLCGTGRVPPRKLSSDDPVPVPGPAGN